MGRKKESIWSEAIEKENIASDKKREAAEFFSEMEKEKKQKKQNNKNTSSELALDDTFVKPKTEKVYVDREKEVMVYTSKNPFKNKSGRAKIKNERDILAADQHGDEDDYKKWGWVGLIFTTLLMVIIIVPILLICMSAALFVDNMITTRDILGYRVNETEFAVKHEESGLYLQNPTYENEQLLLGEDYVNTFTFSTNIVEVTSGDEASTKKKSNEEHFWLQSNMIFESKEMVLNYYEGIPIWSAGFGDDSKISMVKKSSNENEFSIFLDGVGLYIGKDDNSNRIVLTRTPDWFSFEAKIAPYVITNSAEYIFDYEELNFRSDTYIKDLTLNEEGNPVGIRSLENNVWINSYNEIEHKQLPDYTINRNSFKESLVLSETNDTNMFIKTDTDGKLYLSSYQTLPFELFVDSNYQNYYPIVTPTKDGELELRSYDLIADNPLEYERLTKCNFWLVPNPNNLREKAIFFPSRLSFLETENDVLSLKEVSSIKSIDDVDYLELRHSPVRNPEETEVIVRVGGIISGLKANINLKTKGTDDAIDGYEFYGFGGYESSEYAVTNPFDYDTTVRQVANANKNGNGKIRLRNLESDTWYQGIVATYRVKEGGVGQHVTFTYVPPFKTGDRWTLPDKWPELPDINWPDLPDWLWPDNELIDPGDPIGGGGTGDAASAVIWDSTDEVGPDSEIDIEPDEMLELASNSIEISATFQQGTEDGEADRMGVKLEEVDDSGELVAGGYREVMNLSSHPVDGETYTTVFSGLTPETNYKATLLFYDGNWGFSQEVDDISTLELDEGETQMWVTTERLAPEPVAGKVDVSWTESGLLVGGHINHLRETDEIKVLLTDEKTNEQIDTGWIKASEWEDATVDNWVFGVNKLAPDGPYFEAIYQDPIVFDTYQVNMWVRMDVENDFKGWDEYSPAFSFDYAETTGLSPFDVVGILEEEGVSYPGLSYIIK